MKHVVYANECDTKEHNECLDFDCPSSHPVKMPELHLYVRVLDHEGGAHVFADGSEVLLKVEKINFMFKNTEQQ